MEPGAYVPPLTTEVDAPPGPSNNTTTEDDTDVVVEILETALRPSKLTGTTTSVSDAASNDAAATGTSNNGSSYHRRKISWGTNDYLSWSDDHDTTTTTTTSNPQQSSLSALSATEMTTTTLLDSAAPPVFPDDFRLPAAAVASYQAAVAAAPSTAPTVSRPMDRVTSNSSSNVVGDGDVDDSTATVSVHTPPTHGVGDTKSQTTNIDNMPPRPNLYNLRSRSDAQYNISTRKIDLRDVIQRNPLESEAETYIVRMLEARDPVVRPRSESNANASVVLSDIADESLKAFQTVESSAESAMDGTGNNTNRERRDSVRSSVTSAASKQTWHKRSETMEQKLFDLTEALGEMQAHQRGSSGLEDTMDNLTVTKAKAEDAPVVPSASDGLVKQKLYRRRRSRNKSGGSSIQNPNDDGSLILSEDNSNHSRTTVTSHWRQLKLAVKAGELRSTKKTDESVESCNHDGSAVTLDAGDVETGERVSALAGENNSDDNDDEDEYHLYPTDTAGKPTGDTSGKNAVKQHGTILKDFQDFFHPQSSSFFLLCRVVVLYTLIPSIGIAAILFYLAGNPPTGILGDDGKATNGILVSTHGEIVDGTVASVSWWILFGCRQIITLSMAKLVEFFLIDFLSIQNGATMKYMGAWPTLLLLQSKGWPFLLFYWGCFDFALLSGAKPFFSHWGSWQNYVGLFNQTNPSGNIISHDWNHKILAAAVVIGATVSLKRLWLGLYLGRRTFALYSDKLAVVMRKILLVSQVASLGRSFERFEKSRGKYAPSFSLHPNINGLIDVANDEGSAGGLTSTMSDAAADDDAARVFDPDDIHPLTGSLSSAQRLKLSRLLGAWEEPTIAEKTMDYVSVAGILQFRRALACLNTQVPFSGAFGPADSRETCVGSAQETYQRLLLRTPDSNVLSFDVLALLGHDNNGNLNEAKLKELIRLFRPDRDGSLSVLDFVKSVDAVYKEIRLLRASVLNSSKIDQAFEKILNAVFFFLLVTIIVASLGFNPVELFLSFSGVVLAFAWMIGSASSKYFEGLLFILVRRPYQIGDSIHVSNVESDTSFTGSAWWTVEDVNLFSTSVVFLFTNERASLSNGSLANSRIINSSNSPPAWIYIVLRFPVDVSYEKLQVFNKALEEFFRARPREWLAFDAFRAIQVVADKGYIEYIVSAQHRVTFAEWSALHLSKADLMHFCLELSKKLEINYRSPPLPVEFSVVANSGVSTSPNLSDVPIIGGQNTEVNPLQSPDLTDLQAMFVPRSDKKKK